MNVIETTVHFKVNKKNFTQKVEFKIYHNLPETHGMNIYGAIDAWVMRTKDYSAQSLCDYIMSKEIYDVFALTEEAYNEAIKEMKKEKSTKNPQNGK